MNIQKVMAEDHQHTAGELVAHVPQVTVLPDVGAPRSNPLMMIWRRRGILLAVTALCVAAALVWYWVAPAIYRSESRLFVQVPAAKALDGSTSATASNSALRTQCELIKSASILASVLAAPDLADLRTFQDNGGSRWNTLKDKLNATAEKDKDLITVSFESPYPREAQLVVKNVVDAYTTYYTKEKKARVAELEKYRDRTQADLARKQKELLEFKKANASVSFTGGEKGNLAMQKLASLQEAVTQAHIETVNAKSALDSARSKLNDPAQLKNLVEYLRSTGTAISADSNETTIRGQLIAMEAQLDELKRRYLPEHPSVRAAEATVASMKARIGDMDRSLAQSHLIALEQKLTAAQNRESEMQAAYDEQRKTAAAANVTAAEFEQIDAEVKRLAGTVEKAEMQIVELAASENVGVPTVQVFDEANVPTVPVRPVRNTMLLQGLLIGLVFGCFAALVRDWTDQGLRSVEEIHETLGINLLGSVPHMAGAPNPMVQGRKVDLEPASDVAETYRTIRTAVFFGTPERESRTILVTSPAPNDGKSTFASNLAIAMAQTGKRVLLVDCDFRRPVQHRIFETRPGTGLSGVLAGNESLEKAVQATGIAGLDILPCGPIPNNPAEILNSQSFNEVLEELSVRYEHVVIDSPPVMAVADARILAAMCSVTILVLRAESSTRKAALHARKALESVGALILGVVVNDVPRARDRHGDYAGYSGYRAKYNAANPAAEPPQGTGAKTTAMIPARSFLDLRRK